MNRPSEGDSSVSSALILTRAKKTLLGIIDGHEIDPDFEQLYDFASNDDLRFVFSCLHQRLHDLLNHLYIKADYNGHYNAEQSRELDALIKFHMRLQSSLENTQFKYELNRDYEELTQFCSSFLVLSGGSTIPEDVPRITLLEFSPIFTMPLTIQLPGREEPRMASLIVVGEGSYATVYKYQDELYGKWFAVKRAKSDLDQKEIKRFRREFDELSRLHSPYIIEVYKFSKDNREYLMELADTSLVEFYRRKNATLSVGQRKNFAYQILRGIEYIHSKDLLHRDISLSNVLVFNYDDCTVLKLSDFGLVKLPESDLTDLASEIKGSLNDPHLRMVGFQNYSLAHEIYALTQLILFIMTGKTNYDRIKEPAAIDFMKKGLHPDPKQRYQTLNEFKHAFRNVRWE